MRAHLARVFAKRCHPMKQQHLAILLPDARLGGAQRVLLGLAKEFAAQGHKVDVVLLVADGLLLEQMPPAVRCVRLLNTSRPGLFLVFGGFVRLWKYLKTERPTSVLSTGTGTNLLVTVASRLIRRRPRIILREAASVSNRPSFLVRELVRRCFRHADACIGVSAGVSTELRGMGVTARRVHFIPNPVDSEELGDLAQQATPFRPADALPYLISVGRLVPQKDHTTLIRAFARISEAIPHRLIIVGEGACRTELERLIGNFHLQDRILLPGVIQNPQRLIRDAQLFALSSAWEGYPNALLEALAHGVRVVSTNCPHGPAEILEQGRYGALVPVGDDAAMADAILTSLHNRSLAAGWLAAQPRPKEVARRYLAVMRDEELGTESGNGAQLRDS